MTSAGPMMWHLRQRASQDMNTNNNYRYDALGNLIRDDREGD
jgi:hypothetical protein